MLPKNKRAGREAFSCTINRYKSFYSENITLKVLKTKEQEVIRYVFVVSCKVSNKATVRNLIKRRLRSIVFSLDKNVKKGFICIFYIKKGASKSSFSKTKEEIRVLLKKANIIL